MHRIATVKQMRYQLKTEQNVTEQAFVLLYFSFASVMERFIKNEQTEHLIGMLRCFYLCHLCFTNLQNNRFSLLINDFIFSICAVFCSAGKLIKMDMDWFLILI